MGNLDPETVARVIDALAVSQVDVDLVALPGLGFLEVKHYRGQQGRNPRTGEPVTVPDRWMPMFHPDGTILAELNPELMAAPPVVADDEDDEEADEDQDDPRRRIVTVPGAEALGATIRAAVLAGQLIEVPRLGAFTTVVNPGRPAHAGHPAFPSRTLVQFRCAAELKDELTSRRT